VDSVTVVEAAEAGDGLSVTVDETAFLSGSFRCIPNW